MKLCTRLTVVGMMFFLSICCLGGCAKNVALKESFWKNQGTKVGIAIETLPSPSAYKMGSMGLLDIALTAAMDSSLRKHLKETECNDFSAVKDKLADRIRAGGLEPKIMDDFIDSKTLPKVKSTVDGESSIDIRPIAEKYDVDHLLLLKINQVGTIRDYYGFIPLGAPKAYCVAGGVLVDAKTNDKQWAYTMKQSKSKVDISGKWDNPPEYPELDTAIQKAIKNAVMAVDTNFK